MKKLNLVVKGKWYDMIEAGIKKEEYREFNPYWCNRLVDKLGVDYWKSLFSHNSIANLDGDDPNSPEDVIWWLGSVHYDNVKFHRGYTNKTMEFKLKEQVSIGIGNSEWGAPDRKVFILKLGQKLS